MFGRPRIFIVSATPQATGNESPSMLIIGTISMVHVTYMHLSITAQCRGVPTRQPLAEHGTRRDTAYQVHTQISMLRNDIISVFKQHCCTDGCGLMPLRRVNATHNASLEEQRANTLF